MPLVDLVDLPDAPLTYSLLLLLASTTFCLLGLVSVWATAGRSHWLVRLGVVGAIVWGAIGLSAPDVAAEFSVQVVLVGVGIAALRLFWRGPWCAAGDGGFPHRESTALGGRFGIRPLFVLALWGLCWASLALGAPREVWSCWQRITVFAAALSLCTMGAVCLALTDSPWRLFGFEFAVAIAVVLCLGFFPLFNDYIPVCFATWALGVVLASLGRASGDLRTRTRAATESPGTSRAAGSRRPTGQRLCRIAGVAFCLIAAMPAALAVGFLTLTREPVLESPPFHAACDSLLLLARQAPRCISIVDMTLEEGRALLRDNQSLLDRARAALRGGCRLNPESYKGMSQLDIYDKQIVPLRDLKEVFDLDRQVAEVEGRISDAVKSCDDTIRLADAISAYGTAHHLIAASAIAMSAVDALHRVRGRMTAEERRSAAGLLSNRHALLASQHDPFDRDWWSESSDPFRGQSRVVRQVLAITGEERRHGRRVMLWPEIDHVRLLILIAELAVESFRAEHGTYPEKLADLVPRYLEEVPQDPFSGAPFIYRKSATGYVIYSVGPDGRDDGGRSINSREFREENARGGPSRIYKPRGDVVIDDSPLEVGQARERVRHARDMLSGCQAQLENYRGRVPGGGPYPESLADLVPRFLDEIPTDPFSGKPFIYRKTASGYILYSVGPDGRDDGGDPKRDLVPKPFEDGLER